MDRLITNHGLDHIPRKIFGYLDLPTLFKCMCVSSKWQHFIYKIVTKLSKHEEDLQREKLLLERNFPDWTSIFNYFHEEKSDHDQIKFCLLMSNFISDLQSSDLDWSPIFFAITIGDIDSLQLLKSSPASFEVLYWRGPFGSDRPYLGLTPVQFACAIGNAKVVKFFMKSAKEKGIKIEGKDLRRCQYVLFKSCL